jgi:hypothetical protein
MTNREKIEDVLTAIGLIVTIYAAFWVIYIFELE